MIKHRLDCTESLTVDMTTFHAVNFALHAFNDAGFLLLSDAQRDVDLARRFCCSLRRQRVRIPQLAQ
jgi:hypothetical protein